MARRILGLALLLGIFVLAACGGAPASQPPQNSGGGEQQGSSGGTETPAPAEAEGDIVIGVIAPLTGSKAEQGMQFKEGVELAVKELNDKGGILGRPVSIELLDDQGEPNEAAAAAARLAANPDVVVAIGPSSTASSNAAIPMLERARITAISPSASTGSLVTDNQFFYIMFLPTTVYGPLVPEFAVERMQAESLAIIYVKDDYGEGVTNIAKAWAEENGIPVVAEASYTQGARDFRAQLTSILAAQPGAILLNTHYTEGALITRQARDLGYTGPIVGQGTNVYPQFIELAGDAAEGVVAWVDFLASLPTDRVRAAVEKFQAAYGKEPLNYHITSYDAVNILAQAIEQVGNTEDREAIARTVGETRNFPGLVVDISFDENRLPQKELFWVTVKDGEWVLYED